MFTIVWLLSRIIPPPRVAIVTVNNGRDAHEYEKAIENHKSYAKCHEYGFYDAGDVDTKESTPKSIHPYMLKAYALQSFMREHPPSDYGFILWIDRDAIFMNHRVSIQDRLDKLLKDAAKNGGGGGSLRNAGNYDLFIGVERWAWLNSGVLLFRNTPYSANLIDDWIKVYQSRREYYDSYETTLIQGEQKTFRDLFDPQWSCEDQGALIALLAGYDKSKKWNTDRYDGLGKPHVLHEGHEAWARFSNEEILDAKYRSHVKVVAQKWLNTNPWDTNRDAFIYHFNGQKRKPDLIRDYSEQVRFCT